MREGGDFYLDGKPSLYMVTTAAPPSPMLCCRAILALGTCRAPASPRNCQLNSAHWAIPATEAKHDSTPSLHILG